MQLVQIANVIELARGIVARAAVFRGRGRGKAVPKAVVAGVGYPNALARA